MSVNRITPAWSQHCIRVWRRQGASTCQITSFTESVWLQTSTLEQRRVLLPSAGLKIIRVYKFGQGPWRKETKTLQRQPTLLQSVSGHFLQPERFLFCSIWEERPSKLHSGEAPTITPPSLTHLCAMSAQSHKYDMNELSFPLMFLFFLKTYSNNNKKNTFYALFLSRENHRHEINLLKKR